MAPLARPRVRARGLRLHDLHRQLAGRSTSRSPPPSRPTSSSWRPSCRATATSRAASIPLVRAAYLASPPLVVAYALAGRVDVDLTTRAARHRAATAARSCSPTSGRPRRRSGRSSPTSIDPELFRETYASVFEGDERWQAMPIPSGDRYAWDEASTYIANPPFFEGLTAEPAPLTDIEGARVARAAGRLGHDRPHQPRRARSPPGRRPGQWLQAHGRRAARLQLVRRPARPPRGDDARHLRQHPAAQPARRGPEGPYTRPPARRRARRSSTTRRCATATRACRWSSSPGREYGSGSSRDWAAKGTTLLGHPGRHRRELRADPPLQPRRAWACCRSSSCPARALRRSGLTGREAFTIAGLADLGAAPGRGDRGDPLGRRRRRADASGRSPASTARSRSTTCARAASCRRSCGGSRATEP